MCDEEVEGLTPQIVLQLSFPFVNSLSVSYDAKMSSPKKFNRRNVLKSAVAATAAVPLLGGLVGQGAAHAKPVGGMGSGAIPTKAQWRELKKSVNGPGPTKTPMGTER